MCFAGVWMHSEAGFSMTTILDGDTCHIYDATSSICEWRFVVKRV